VNTADAGGGISEQGVLAYSGNPRIANPEQGLPQAIEAFFT
jgi:hypothetical protein